MERGVDQYTEDKGTKTSRPNQERREITWLEKYLMAVAVLSVLVPMVTLFFLPLAAG